MFYNRYKSYLISVFLVSILTLAPVMAPISDAQTQQCYSDYSDAVAEYQQLPDEIALAIYGDALFDSYIDGTYAENIFIESFIKYVKQYSNNEFVPRDYSSYIIDSTGLIVDAVSFDSEDTRGGVTKIEKYEWGYDVFISSSDMNNIATSGSGVAGILATLFASVPAGIIITLATTILGLILNNMDYDGIAFEIHTHTVIDVFGYHLVFPMMNPTIQNIRPQ